MTRPRQTRTIAGAVVLGAALAVLLAGCVNPLQVAIKQATGGKVDLGTGVPADFPASIPLYKGHVTSGVSMGEGDDRIWNVIMDVPGASVMPTIAAQLEKAGYTTDLDTTVDSDGGSLIYEDDEYDIGVVLKHTSKGYTVDYAVSRMDE